MQQQRSTQSRLINQLPVSPLSALDKATRLRYERLRLQKQKLQLEQKNKSVDFEQYKDDPEGFVSDVLQETLTDDLREICRAVAQYPVVIAQSGNGTGKSWIEGRIALWFYCCRPGAQVYCAAAPPQSNLENILWAELLSVTDKHPKIIDDSDVKSLKIQRNSLEFIAGVTIPTAGNDAQKQARFSGKHAPSLLFLFDEGDAIPDPVYDGADTCLSGGFDRMLITFNPRQRLGAVYRMIKSGQAKVVKLSAFNHPNVITGKDVIPGAVTRDKTARRVNQWCRPMADGETRDKRCFELPAYMVGVVATDQQERKYPPLKEGWYKIDDHRFSHVVLGEYPAQSDNQLISEEWIDRARSNYDLFVAKHGVIIPEHVGCVCGLDIADAGKDDSVLTKKFGNFVHPQKVWEGEQDVGLMADVVKAELILSGIKNVRAINCDGTGVGAGVAGMLARDHKLPGVKVMVANSPTELNDDEGQFGLLLDQLMWRVREWLKNEPNAMLPPEPELIEELLAFTYGVEKGKIKVSSTDDVKDLLKRSPDRARSLMLCFMSGGLFQNADLS